MHDDPARVERLDLAPGRRILVISDIHGNLPYLKGALARAAFSAGDELIFDGDFLEKGGQSLETLRCIMALCRAGNAHAVCGNCDDWANIYSPRHSAGLDERVLRYILWKKSGLLWDMFNLCGIDPCELDDFSLAKAKLRDAFPEEWAFLAALPHAIETESFVFAHAGMRPDLTLRAQTAGDLDRCDSFLTRGWRFDKWVVVGHWPVMLYGTDRVCSNPIVDREKRIVSIDGGCVLKDDGQLNVLIIPDRDSDSFGFAAYDPFPERKVLEPQTGGGRSYYIRWGDNRVQVLRRGGEFSRCRHVRTGYEMDILTKYLYTDNEFTDCNDCTDYVLPLCEGDRVRVVEETSRGWFVKHKGWSGWYYGELE